MAKSDLTDMSINALQSEIKRREKHARMLQKRREKLVQQLAEIDAEIAGIGGLGGGGRGGRRPRNDSNLPEALVGVLTGKTMSVTEAAEAVQKAGYITTSPNFRTIVNQALIRDKRFKRVGRGLYTASGAGAKTSERRPHRCRQRQEMSTRRCRRSPPAALLFHRYRATAESPALRTARPR